VKEEEKRVKMKKKEEEEGEREDATEQFVDPRLFLVSFLETLW